MTYVALRMLTGDRAKYIGLIFAIAFSTFLTENDLYRVRSVPGVLWAVRLFKAQPRAKALDGTFRVVIMMGLDDSSLVGAPTRDKMLLGAVDDLRQPDTVIIDRVGSSFLLPG